MVFQGGEQMIRYLLLTAMASGAIPDSGSVPSADSAATHIDAILQYGLDRLPQSPVKDVDLSSFSSYMGVINYFIPVGTLLGILAAFLAAYAAYLVISFLLRKAHIIG